MRYIRSRYSNTIFRVVHEGEDYVLAVKKGEKDIFDEAFRFRYDQYEEYKPEPQVGDKVIVKGGRSTPYTLLYIHQLDERKFGVVAYEGDIPYSFKFEQLEKVE